MPDHEGDCPVCDEERLKFGKGAGAPVCESCGFEQTPPPNNQGTRGKTEHLGSYISYSAKGNWEKLRKTHLEILNEEELKRRRLSRSDLRTKIAAYWKSSLRESMSELDKGKIGAEIAERYGVLDRVVVEVLKEEGWARANWGVFDYRLLEKYGDTVGRLWKKFKGKKVIEKGRLDEKLELVEKMYLESGLKPYVLVNVVEGLGLWKRGSQKFSELEKCRDFGGVILNIWETRSEDFEDDESFCKAIEELSLDTGRVAGPYLIISCLSEAGKVNYSETVGKYVRYNCSREILKSLEGGEVKSATELSNDTGIGFGSIQRAAKMLFDDGSLTRSKVGSTFYYSLKGTEDSLEEKVFEKEVLEKLREADSTYTNISHFSTVGRINRSYSRSILKGWAEKKKLIKFDRIGRTKFYMLSGDYVESKNPVRDFLIDYDRQLLGSMDEGSTLSRLSGGGNKISYSALRQRLKLLEGEDVIFSDGEKFFLKKDVVKKLEDPPIYFKN